MRTPIILALAAAALVPTAAHAQQTLRDERRDVREARRDVLEERQELRDAYRSGDPRAVREERREYRDAARDYHRERQEYQRERRDYRDDRRDNRYDERRYAYGQPGYNRPGYNQDWRRYRDSNRDVFRGGAYNAPYGNWQYRAVAPGYRIQPNFYASRYWINDPYRYRLPRPAAYHRWVRYGPDVLLIDTRRGIVLEVLRGFFY